MKSLQWRIIFPFSGLILLAVLLSGYLAVRITRQQFDTLVTDESRRQAAALADQLERQYNNENVTLLPSELSFHQGLTAVEAPKVATAVTRNELSQDATNVQMQGAIALRQSGTSAVQLPPASNGRFFITDKNGTILHDSLGLREGQSLEASLLGEGTAVYDTQTGDIIGNVVAVAGEGFYAPQEQAFLGNVTRSLLMVVLLIGGLALLIGWWLTRKVMAPVTAVTQAATQIAQQGTAARIPIHSDDELGQMSHAFNQMADALREQQTLRHRLISDVSHELRTPLSILNLEMEALEDGLQSADEAIARMRQETALLASLSQDLRLLAQSDQGELQLDLQVTAIGDWLISTVSRWQVQAESRHVILELQPLPPQLPSIHMDPVRMNQVMGNLIQNTLHYTPENGRVQIECHADDKYITITVADNGRGITDVDLPFVFERFYRTDQSRERNKGGRGLGLSIVRQIVTAHCGEIWVDSKVG